MTAYSILKRSDRPNVDSLFELGLAMESFYGFEAKSIHQHSHDIVELVYVRNGRGVYVLEDEEVEVGPGSLAIVHYHQRHGFRTPYGPMDLINCYLDLDLLRLPSLGPELNSILPHVLPLHQRFGHQLRRIVYLQLADPEKAERLLDALAFELKEPQTAARTKSVEHIFAAFLIACCRASNEVADQHLGLRGDPSIVSCCEFIRDHLHEDIGLEDCAAFCNWTPQHCSRRFKQITGVSLNQYIRHRRLEQAMLRLRNEHTSILDVAFSCGFGSLEHFNRVFKKEVGCTPGVWRKS